MEPLSDLAKLDNLFRLPFRNGSGSVLLEASAQSLTEIVSFRQACMTPTGPPC
jgi:hypothetical protein